MRVEMSDGVAKVILAVGETLTVGIENVDEDGIIDVTFDGSKFEVEGIIPKEGDEPDTTGTVYSLEFESEEDESEEYHNEQDDDDGDEDESEDEEDE